MRSSIQIVLLALLISSTLADPQCLNQNNKKVDWFIALKLPAGTQYAYCDSDGCSSLEVQSTLLDDQGSSPLFNTMQQIQNINSDQYGSIFWNDQPPTNKSVPSSYAHSKGFMGFGKNNGFLMVHSTPKFPIIENGEVQLEIGSGQQVFGQHFFCMSTSTADLDQIASAYNIDWPFVYDGNVPSFLSNFPYFTRMLKNTRDNESQSQAINFTTLGGVSMTKFSKSGNWVVPFYDNVPASTLKTSLFVESWGSPQEDSDCSNNGPSVTSNVAVSFASANVQYKWTKDHSKYAISSDPKKPFVCLGDINRQQSQWKRGGGTVCFSNKQVYQSFSNIMVQQQDCGNSESAEY